MARHRTLGMNLNELRRYAVEGARAQVENLRGQIARILAVFPELNRSGDSGAAPRPMGESAATRRGRRAMSAAQRKAVSERMTRYWAQRRGAKQSRTGARRGARKMSAAARKRISDAQKKRWAAVRKLKR
jgi:hypothetical protein